MKLLRLLVIAMLLVFNCKEEPKTAFNIEVESLSVNAEAKTASWIGYSDFSFELKNIAENYNKEFAIKRTRNLLSAAQSVLYSMPSELRNETTNTKAQDMVNATKELYNSMTTKSEEEIISGLEKISVAFDGLNKEINYYTDNPD